MFAQGQVDQHLTNFGHLEYMIDELKDLSFKNNKFDAIDISYRIEKSFGFYSVTRLVNDISVKNCFNFPTLNLAREYINELKKIDLIDKKYKYRLLVQWHLLSGYNQWAAAGHIAVFTNCKRKGLHLIEDEKDITDSTPVGMPFVNIQNGQLYVKTQDGYVIIPDNHFTLNLQTTVPTYHPLIPN